MDKIKIHNLKVKLRVLNDNLLKVNQEINNITDSVQLSEESPITDIPKSAPFNVRVEKTLDDLHERIRQIELYLGLYIKEQPERKIVFDWLIEEGRLSKDLLFPSEYEVVKELLRDSIGQTYFAATMILPNENITRIYIGHYE